MNQNMIALNGIQLAYLEVNPDAAKTIFFLHGNSGSSKTWMQQLCSPLLTSYRLIAFDLPGHGQSEDASDCEKQYSLSGLGDTLASAIQSLKKQSPFILAGFSLGTNIIGEMLREDLLPEGVALFSPCVMRTIDDLQQVFHPNPNSAVFFNDSFENEKLEMLTRDCFAENSSTNHSSFQYDFMNTRAPFRSTLLRKCYEGQFHNEIEILSDKDLPLLIVFGKDDVIVNSDYLDNIGLRTWNDTIYKLNAAGHFVHIDSANSCNELLAGYAEDRFRGHVVR